MKSHITTALLLSAVQAEKERAVQQNYLFHHGQAAHDFEQTPLHHQYLPHDAAHLGPLQHAQSYLKPASHTRLRHGSTQDSDADHGIQIDHPIQHQRLHRPQYAYSHHDSFENQMDMVVEASHGQKNQQPLLATAPVPPQAAQQAKGVAQPQPPVAQQDHFLEKLRAQQVKREEAELAYQLELLKDIAGQQAEIQKDEKSGQVTSEHRLADLRKWEAEMKRDLDILQQQKAQILKESQQETETPQQQAQQAQQPARSPPQQQQPKQHPTVSSPSQTATQRPAATQQQPQQPTYQPQPSKQQPAKQPQVRPSQQPLPIRLPYQPQQQQPPQRQGQIPLQQQQQQQPGQQGPPQPAQQSQPSPAAPTIQQAAPQSSYAQQPQVLPPRQQQPPTQQTSPYEQIPIKQQTTQPKAQAAPQPQQAIYPGPQPQQARQPQPQQARQPQPQQARQSQPQPQPQPQLQPQQAEQLMPMYPSPVADPNNPYSPYNSYQYRSPYLRPTYLSYPVRLPTMHPYPLRYQTPSPYQLSPYQSQQQIIRPPAYQSPLHETLPYSQGHDPVHKDYIGQILGYDTFGSPIFKPISPYDEAKTSTAATSPRRSMLPESDQQKSPTDQARTLGTVPQYLPARTNPYSEIGFPPVYNPYVAKQQQKALWKQQKYMAKYGAVLGTPQYGGPMYNEIDEEDDELALAKVQHQNGWGVADAEEDNLMSLIRSPGAMLAEPTMIEEGGRQFALLEWELDGSGSASKTIDDPEQDVEEEDVEDSPIIADPLDMDFEHPETRDQTEEQVDEAEDEYEYDDELDYDDEQEDDTAGAHEIMPLGSYHDWRMRQDEQEQRDLEEHERQEKDRIDMERDNRERNERAEFEKKRERHEQHERQLREDEERQKVEMELQKVEEEKEQKRQDKAARKAAKPKKDKKKGKKSKNVLGEYAVHDRFYSQHELPIWMQTSDDLEMHNAPSTQQYHYQPGDPDRKNQEFLIE